MTNNDEQIILSQYTEKLLESIEYSNTLSRKFKVDPLQVSETMSFLAFLYEKIRNSVEFSEEHLIRRLAISRVLRRRLLINPSGEGEGENLARELLWAKYMQNGTLGQIDADLFQKIINAYLKLKKRAYTAGVARTSNYLSDLIIEFMSCEIEETLFPDQTNKKLSYLFFLYQVIRNKISIEGISPEDCDTYVYISTEASLLKNDNAFIRYHLFTHQYGKISTLKKEQIDSLLNSLKTIFLKIDLSLKNIYRDRLTRFIKRQLPPFLILFQILDKQSDKKAILENSKKLWSSVLDECTLQYQETGAKLRGAGIRSIIYIFLTKMIFVLILEIPLTQYLYGSLHMIPIGINTLFPPLLMGLIVTFVNPPTSDNTKRIYDRIVHIINSDPNYEKDVQFKISKKAKIKRPFLFTIFSILYGLLFITIFGSIYVVLDYFEFNIISKGIFFFFVCVVTFFGYRIRQIAKEYAIAIKQSFWAPITDAILLPILSIGRVLSQELSKINILMFIFDALIEVPFKLLIEIIEEWFKFTRSRKDEII